MCLLSDTNEKKIATRGIFCYKVVQEPKENDGFYMTPYREAYILKSEIIGLKSFKPSENEGIIKKSDVYPDKYLIGEGFIHTCLYAKDAFEIARRCNDMFEGTFVVYLCVIPENAVYFEGRDLNGKCGFASSEIIFKEKYE